MILVSDSGRCAGLPDGAQFDLGGQSAWLRDGVGKLADGTIACSATNLYQCMLNCLRWQIREEDVIKAATYNPACALGVEDQVGSIATGKTADFLVCTSRYATRRVFLAGQEV